MKRRDQEKNMIRDLRLRTPTPLPGPGRSPWCRVWTRAAGSCRSRRKIDGSCSCQCLLSIENKGFLYNANVSITGTGCQRNGSSTLSFVTELGGGSMCWQLQGG